MNLSELKASPGSKKAPFRKGRGPGSGNGKTAGKGHKGQNARAGGGVRPGFEGGQMPLYRRIPKRGFNNKRYEKVFSEINVSRLNVFEDDSIVTQDLLLEKGIIKKVETGVAILGGGELSRKLTVKAAKFSEAAKSKIEAAGGKVEVE